MGAAASFIWAHSWGFFANKPSTELDTKGMRAFLVLYTLVQRLVRCIQHWKLAQGFWMILHISSPVRKHKYGMKECDASKIFALRDVVMILEWTCKFVLHFVTTNFSNISYTYVLYIHSLLVQILELEDSLDNSLYSQIHRPVCVSWTTDQNECYPIYSGYYGS